MGSLIKIHRFLMSQVFYPLVLSSLFSLALYAGRAMETRRLGTYSNLVWNLFLAWLPYLFSILAAAIHRLLPKQWWYLVIPGALWLLFFPNAPYIVTDFYHLHSRPGVPLWYDILILAGFSWTGIFLAIASLRTIQHLIRNYLGGFVSWLFVAVAMGISALGIYLGRFERWNSWDFFIHPRRILRDILALLANPGENRLALIFTILFTAFLIICYLTFINVAHYQEMEEAG